MSFPTPPASFGARIHCGLRHVRANPLLWQLVLAVVIAFAVIGTYDSTVFAALVVRTNVTFGA